MTSRPGGAAKPRSVPTDAKPHRISRTVAASRGPNRKAAHSSTGMNTNSSGYVFVVNGATPPNTTCPTPTMLSSSRAASSGRSRIRPGPGWRIQSNRVGTTTRSPATSP